MPIILVVDDSRFDRRLIGGLLEKDIDWLVEYADNGMEALDRMRIARPDVVVTDLLMPTMGGLEFIEAVRQEFSSIPVIVVTGQGSEALASQALRQGATSYVPKLHLADGLLETVEQVLRHATTNKKLEQLLKSTTLTRHEFQLSNDPEMIPVLTQFVQRTMEQTGFCSAAQRMHAAVALEEALLNAIYHGNLELPEETLPRVRQELHAEQRSELIDDRRHERPYAERCVRVSFTMDSDKARFVVRNEGPGFDAARLSANGEPKDLRGRGLVLIRNFMDSVKFNEDGTEISMTFKRSPEPQTPTPQAHSAGE